MNLPRRKVISSYERNGFFTCTLSCGHRETAYGLTPKNGGSKLAPKSCGCHKCAEPSETRAP